MSIISGVAGGAILAIVNTAAAADFSDPSAPPRLQLVLLFVVAILIYILSKWWSAIRTATVLEHQVTDLRLRVCEKLRQADLETIEGIDKAEAYTAITQDASRIAQSGFLILNTAQQAVVLVAGSLYLIWLSMTAFLLFVAGSAFAVWQMVSHRESLMDAVRKDAEKQTQLFGYLNHLLDGFKEIKLNQGKSEEIFKDMTEVANASRHLRLRSSQFYVMSSLLAEMTLFLLLGCAVFVLPELIQTYSEILVKATVAIMFVFAPLATVVGALPQVAGAQTSIQRLFELERRLDEKSAATADEAEGPGSFADFLTIRLCDAGFTYATSGSFDPFSIGPIKLEIRRGETLFIVGGNGSGKTTMLKLIAGLYEPKTGTITVDDVPVTRPLQPRFRSLFAGVFGDFHLFDRLYGVGTVDEATANDLLARMGISHKVKVVDGRFSTLELSTGQRKRLALIASLLEDRLVYIFDEWTADQDPHFREEFYRRILPGLKTQGKTIIAITHDDRYWDQCDRIVKLDYGQIVSMGSNPQPAG
jgi:putative ATP-binding cassette transporter